jgi:sensor domain CHASE-containing protein
MTSRSRRKLPLKVVLPALIVAVQVLLAMVAWRDLSRRTDQQVRGKKKFWRVFVVMNPGNSLAYWLFGRRG